MEQTTSAIKQKSLHGFLDKLLTDYEITEQEWLEMEKLGGKIMERIFNKKKKEQKYTMIPCDCCQEEHQKFRNGWQIVNNERNGSEFHVTLDDDDFTLTRLPNPQKPGITVGEIDALIRKAQHIAHIHADGHLTIFKFTTNWRVSLRTPFPSETREFIDKATAGDTLEEALKNFIKANS